MTPLRNDEDVLVREFTKELHNHNAAVFVGAGLSVGAEYVDWLGLLRDLIVDLGLDPHAESDFVTLAQCHCNEVGGGGRLTQVVFDKFRETHEPTINHRLQSRLPIYMYWTTYYDKLLETASGRIAVNVINHLGDEVMKVFPVERSEGSRWLTSMN